MDSAHVCPPRLQEDLQYCVERLVRGLGSNRKGARQGFSIALTEVLASFPQQVTPGEVLSLVAKHLQPSGSAKAEVRGHAACVRALFQTPGRLVLHVPGYVSLLLCQYCTCSCSVNVHFSVGVRARVWYYLICRDQYMKYWPSWPVLTRLRLCLSGGEGLPLWPSVCFDVPFEVRLSHRQGA